MHRGWNNALPLRPGSWGSWALRLDPNSTLDENNWGHWRRLDKRLQKDGGAGRHRAGWHRDSGYHHRFGLKGWLPGREGFA